MRKIHVIILAQGSQSRLPELKIPKQFLPLAGCAGCPILLRTFLQLARLNTGRLNVSVVCHQRMVDDIHSCGANHVRKGDGASMHFVTTVLRDPGNSSLKGIARYFAQAKETALGQWLDMPDLAPDATVVLLGDVVYSWGCLEALLATGYDAWTIKVAATSDLGPSSGELWGLAWTREQDAYMRERLEAALAKHPPFHDTYQPGQMRQWLYAMHPLMQKGALVRFDDYTDDVDVPEDLIALKRTSELAAIDDEMHGLTW